MHLKWVLNETSENLILQEPTLGDSAAWVAQKGFTPRTMQCRCAVQDPNSLGGHEELWSYALSVASRSNQCLHRLAVSTYRADTGWYFSNSHPSLFGTCLAPTEWRREIQLEDPTFHGIIEQFGLEGTSGDTSQTCCCKQDWIQACGYTIEMPFEVFTES